MSELASNCPCCGSEPSVGEENQRAFVRYTPEPNDAQEELEWAAELPELRGLVCTECGYVIGVIDVEDPDRVEESSNDFRVEEELK